MGVVCHRNRYEAVYTALHLGAFQTSGELPSAGALAAITEHLTRVKWIVAVYVLVCFFMLSDAFALVYPAFIDLTTPAALQAYFICVDNLKPVCYILLSSTFTILVLQMIRAFQILDTEPQGTHTLHVMLCCLCNDTNV